MNNLTGFSRVYKLIALVLAVSFISYLILSPVEPVRASIVLDVLGLPIEGALVRLVAYPQYSAFLAYFVCSVRRGNHQSTNHSRGAFQYEYQR